ncbi:MAG: phosphatidylglycerol lysyltransferase domain-containing protein [Deltaproteobacteria bacterium]|jgi:hypothetical protein|nr:phosphatidylglycerol lysyltransferase domain-containing protein [Deltaproteobacteria bacterium]
MSFKPLTIEDRPSFTKILEKWPLRGSDANFTNMFIWMNYYNFVWDRVGDSLCVLAYPQGGTPFAFYPLGDPQVLEAWDYLASSLSEPLFARVPEDLANLIQKHRPTWEITPDRDNDDYIYATEKLKTLSGRAMHQKKNHYNSFVQNNRFTILPIEKKLFPELIAVEDKWLTLKMEKGTESSHLIKEKEAVHNILQNFEALEVQGIAIKIEGAIEAFSIGEVINSDTAVVHVEKGNPDIRGIYVALVSHFCRSVFPEVTYLNREQDLGLPGLRRSKESLKPHHFIRKFQIRPR